MSKVNCLAVLNMCVPVRQPENGGLVLRLRILTCGAGSLKRQGVLSAGLRIGVFRLPAARVADAAVFGYDAARSGQPEFF